MRDTVAAVEAVVRTIERASPRKDRVLGRGKGDILERALPMASKVLGSGPSPGADSSEWLLVTLSAPRLLNRKVGLPRHDSGIQ